MDKNGTANTWAIMRLTTLEQFDSLACEWEALLKAAQIENIFLTHAWLREWWRIYGTHYELWTLVARGATGLGGIAPLILERGPGGTRRLTFMGETEIEPTYFDLIMQPELRTDLTREFWSYLWQTRTEWDILNLDFLPAESPTRALLVDSLTARNLTVQTAISFRVLCAALPNSFEEYLKSRGPSTRKRLREQQNKLARDFPMARFRRVETGEELDTAFDTLVRLHQARWTERGYRGVFPTETAIGFHRAIAHQALARGCLRLYFLQIGDALVAIVYCLRAGSRTFMYRICFDESWAKYSVGILLMTYAIKQSFAEATLEFTFGTGLDDYKAHWVTGVHESWRVRVASPHLRGRLAWIQMQITGQLIAWAVRHIPRTTRSKVRHLLHLA